MSNFEQWNISQEQFVSKKTSDAYKRRYKNKGNVSLWYMETAQKPLNKIWYNILIQNHTFRTLNNYYCKRTLNRKALKSTRKHPNISVYSIWSPFTTWKNSHENRICRKACTCGSCQNKFNGRLLFLRERNLVHYMSRLDFLQTNSICR